MVFPAVKALFRRILMRNFAVLPGFFKFCYEKYRIFDQILHISDLLVPFFFNRTSLFQIYACSVLERSSASKVY